MFYLPLRGVLAAATFILLPVHTAATPSVQINITVNANLSLPGLPYNPGLDQIYLIKDVYCGEDFFDSWTWEAIEDPTHGRVNYVSKEDAIRSGLSYASGEKFIMRVDSTSLVPPAARGRDSVRIKSNTVYGDSVVILDASHIPYGCATWPAFWSFSRKGPWPHGGEIDIIEGVNLNTANQETLHTTPDCTMEGVSRKESGSVTATNCDVNVNYNAGCGVSSSSQYSYGPSFAAAGGGWYAMERSPTTGIRIWFWSRNQYDSVPLDVQYDLGYVDPSNWGVPDSDFPTTACDYASHFDDYHQLIFDTTLCGDWAGSVYSQSGCPGNCTDYVDNNPAAFKDAYWEVDSVRVYTPFV